MRSWRAWALSHALVLILGVVGVPIAGEPARVAGASTTTEEGSPGDSGGDTAERLAESTAAAAAVAAEVDVLTATNAEVVAALTALNAAVALQAAQVAETQAATDAAVAAADEAAARADEIAAETAVLEDRSRELALALYLHRPSERMAEVIASEPSDATPARLVLVRFQVEDLAVLVDELKAKRVELSEALDRAQAAADDAAAASSREEGRLAELRIAVSERERVAADVEARIEGALEQADALEVLNASLSAQLRSEQVALAASLSAASELPVARDLNLTAALGEANGTDGATQPRPLGRPAEGPTSATTVPPSPAPASALPTPTPTSPPPPTTAPATLAPPTTAPPTTAPPTTPTTKNPAHACPAAAVNTRWVSGIEVNVSIADSFAALMNKAEADGIKLLGSGYRSCARQVEIRREVCGPTDYDIWEKPSSQCSPPVAIPGRSMHQQGLAIDFILPATWDLIRSRQSPEFVWLQANAPTFGLFNLPSEPWHWSTNGR